MPFFKAAQKIVYFAHVPKCGGSAVEDYLLARFGAVSFLDKNFFAQPASLHWTRSSAQHISADALVRLFPADFFDASFAVVRHPVDRLECIIDPRFRASADWAVRLGFHFESRMKRYGYHGQDMDMYVKHG